MPVSINPDTGKPYITPNGQKSGGHRADIKKTSVLMCPGCGKILVWLYNFLWEETMEHLDGDVRQALVRLCDALCTWERNTGRESVLILREQKGFVFRAMSGKPVATDDVVDAQLLQIIDT